MPRYVNGPYTESGTDKYKLGLTAWYSFSLLSKVTFTSAAHTENQVIKPLSYTKYNSLVLNFCHPKLKKTTVNKTVLVLNQSL